MTDGAFAALASAHRLTSLLSPKLCHLLAGFKSSSRAQSWLLFFRLSCLRRHNEMDWSIRVLFKWHLYMLAFMLHILHIYLCWSLVSIASTKLKQAKSVQVPYVASHVAKQTYGLTSSWMWSLLVKNYVYLTLTRVSRLEVHPSKQCAAWWIHPWCSLRNVQQPR